MSGITLVVGDLTPDLTAILSDANGPADLTGAAVELRLKPNDGSATLVVPCTIDSPETAGVVRHVWDIDETAEPVVYKVEFVVTYANGKPETFPVLGSDVPTITVRARKT